MGIQEKMAAHGPKKILSLDGGGIRGMITIEILAKIEAQLRQRNGRNDYVLADYFDYMSGTSTGAIIATALSLGWEVSKLRDFYLGSGKVMFDGASWLRRFRYKYEDENLSRTLQDHIGADTTLDSDKLQTLLMVVLRNATTDSPWPVSNNPQAKYNNPTRSDNNGKLPLWQLVRASTAAPTYFPPETIQMGDKSFVFVDGGVTMYNNPAFQTFLMATLPAYKLAWPTGADKILLVSIGTGSAAAANANLKPGEMNLLYNAGSIPGALMFAAQNEQDLLCRSFGRCLHGDDLDREVGNLRAPECDADRNLPALFTYLRYNAQVDKAGLSALGLPDIDPRHVQQMDSVEYVSQLQRVGKAVAEQVNPEHFAGFD